MSERTIGIAMNGLTDTMGVELVDAAMGSWQERRGVDRAEATG